MSHCVYWVRRPEHTDMATQGYVGVSNNSARRFVEHSKCHKGQSRHLSFAIKKYGWDVLVKTEILIADKDYCLAIEQKLRPKDSIGWNCAAGGGMPPSSKGRRYKLKNPSWNLGLRMPPESAKKVSQSISKLWENPEYRKRMSEAHKGHAGPMVGKTHSEATKLKQSLVKLGKLSKKKGICLTPEVLENVRAASRIVWDCPYCKKQGKSKGAANRWHFEACRIKELT